MLIPKQISPSYPSSSASSGCVHSDSGTSRPHNMIVVKVPVNKNFNLPEGTFRAHLLEIRLRPSQNHSDQQEVRFMFRVDIPGKENQLCVAWRAFELNLNPGSQLYNFLTAWLTSDYWVKNSGKDVDLCQLEGKGCILTLQHFQGAGYTKPLVYITGIYPAAQDTKTETERVSQ